MNTLLKTCDTVRRAWILSVTLFAFATQFLVSHGYAQLPTPIVLDVWPSTPPGETKTLPPESDQTKPTDKLIAGRRIIKLGNVSKPQIAVYRPTTPNASRAAVVVCPGGGHHILAYDLEGTEVAEWLTRAGVTAIVLKYRVPFRDPDRRWIAGVQDAQRALSLVRSKASDWNLDPNRIGLLGFSAGGEITAIASLDPATRHYAATDAIDQTPFAPNFSFLIYPGGLTVKDQPTLRPGIAVTQKPPPMFFAHAFDDPVTPLNSLLLATEVKKAGGQAELHIFASGGHGYGLRPVPEFPVTQWPKLAQSWMQSIGVLQ